jgi:hypothetical protein
MIYPVILQGVTPAVAADVISAPLDARGLQNRTDKIVRIDEIRFRPSDLDVFGYANVQLRLGNEPITAGFVPLPAMTWPVGDFANEYGQSFGSGFYARFSKPVYLAPGERITAQWSHSLAGRSPSLAITVICQDAGVMLDRGFVPWFSFYKPPARADGTGDFEDTSTEANLSNPFDDSILVERLIGRTFAGAETILQPDQSTNPLGEFGIAFDGLRIRIEDQDAIQIVRDGTPFGLVFDFVRKSWIVNSTLRAKGFYRVSLQSNFSTEYGNGGNAPTQSFVGMLGYRKVR